MKEATIYSFGVENIEIDSILAVKLLSKSFIQILFFV